MSGEVVIDGSQGEGGGQVLRTALAFSVISGRSVSINGIRQNRPKPGLAAQHLSGLKLISDICGAELSGNSIGSGTVEFKPGPIEHGNYELDVGTAGSITLVLQTVLPVLASVKGASRIILTGGTDVNWSPPLDYYTLVLFPLLAKSGFECIIETESRGYYPKGGGKVVASIRSEGRMRSIALERFSGINGIDGIVNITALPMSIAERVRESALAALPPDMREMANITIEHRENGTSQGVGIILAATDGQTIVGASSLGEKGKSAEKVGREAASSLISEMNVGGAVDSYASDQLLPYLAISGGHFTSGGLTGHARTNIATIEKFKEGAINVDEASPTRFWAEGIAEF